MGDSVEGGNGADGAAESKSSSKEKTRRGSTKREGNLYLLCENALDKLVLLDYQNTFCKINGCLPFPRNYFAEPASNSSTQWANFVALVSWLSEKLGHEFAVDKWDDPTTSGNKLMLTLKQLGFQLDFPVSKLKQAHGEAVCNVLHFLLDKVLKLKGFQWMSPVHAAHDAADDAIEDVEGDLAEDDIEETIESEEEEDGLGASFRGTYAKEAEGTKQAVLQSHTDPEYHAAWRTELERVGPKLRSRLAGLGNEWRSHLEQTKSHQVTIDKVLPDCAKDLSQIHKILSTSLERITAKERLLSNQFENLANQYRETRQELVAASEAHESGGEAIEKLSNELANVTDALDELKGNMDDRGNSMTDTSPLQKMRQAVNQLKKDNEELDIQIGVVNHTLSIKKSLLERKKSINPQQVY